MTARTMSRDEESLFYFQIVAAEIQIGLRCGTCMQRACSLEYGPFECRGEKPVEAYEARLS
jgi:hypothetical protein